MSIRIIDNKKIDLTDIEYSSYQSICQSYNKKTFKGESLFIGLFETDNNGMIIKLVPPTRETSMEVCIFLMFLFNAQQSRTCMHALEKKTNDFLAEQKLIFEKTLAEIKK